MELESLSLRLFAKRGVGWLIQGMAEKWWWLYSVLQHSE